LLLIRDPGFGAFLTSDPGWITSDPQHCLKRKVYHFLSGLDKETSKKFIKRNWNIFTSFTTASILRQAAISYLAGYHALYSSQLSAQIKKNLFAITRLWTLQSLAYRINVRSSEHFLCLFEDFFPDLDAFLEFCFSSFTWKAKSQGCGSLFKGSGTKLFIEYGRIYWSGLVWSG
jgi:hypothetical protein